VPISFGVDGLSGYRSGLRPRIRSRVRAMFAVAVAALFFLLTLLAPIAGLVVTLDIALSGAEPVFWLSALFGSLTWFVWRAMFSSSRRDATPSLALGRDAQPRLWAAVDQAAAALGEAPPDVIHFSLDVEAAVSERGVLRRGRELVLGLPLIERLTIAQLRIVLTHEFAHLAGGDSRASRWVWRAHEAVERVTEELAGGLFGPIAHAWGHLFLRATAAIARRQELAADAVAARMFGVNAASQTLQVVRATAIGWDAYWWHYVVPALDKGFLPPILEGFSYFLSRPRVGDFLDTALRDDLSDETCQPLDTHPPLRERIRAIERVATKGGPIKPRHDDLEIAASLVDGAASVEGSALAAVSSVEHVSALKPLPWEASFAAIWQPFFRTQIADFADVLAGSRVADLPQLADRVREAATARFDSAKSEERDPTSDVLGAALVLALAREGWSIEALPGELVATSSPGGQVKPFRLVDDLLAGDLDEAGWRDMCLQKGLPASLLTEPGEDRADESGPEKNANSGRQDGNDRRPLADLPYSAADRHRIPGRRHCSRSRRWWSPLLPWSWLRRGRDRWLIRARTSPRLASPSRASGRSRAARDSSPDAQATAVRWVRERQSRGNRRWQHPRRTISYPCELVGADGQS
jgi:heat shock protein HtpX